jgi:DNA-binding FadR family transcriptional regulator
MVLSLRALVRDAPVTLARFPDSRFSTRLTAVGSDCHTVDQVTVSGSGERFVSTATTKSPVNELLNFVRSEGYGPGDRLPPIRQLSVKLGFGRNAIRDGLVEAQSLGYVKIEPRLGVFVQDPDPAPRADHLVQALSQDEQNLFHLVDARLLVESEVAAEAARTRRPEDLLSLREALKVVLTSRGDRLDFIKADEAFHLTIARIAGNRVLFVFLQTLWRMIRPAKSNLLLSADSREVSDREHQELLQSIVDGDAARARNVMRGHIGRGRSLLLEYAHTLPSTNQEHGNDKIASAVGENQ